MKLIICRSRSPVGLGPMGDDGRLGEAEREGFDEVESTRHGSAPRVA
jgi:hypothetical protein